MTPPEEPLDSPDGNTTGENTTADQPRSRLPLIIALVLITVVAGVAGGWWYFQRRPVADLEELGANIVVDRNRIARIHLTEKTISSKNMKQLGAIKNVRVLNLSGSQLPDTGLEGLENLTDLILLGLAHTNVTDAMLRKLKQFTSLEQLMLGDCENLTDDGLKSLAGVPKLIQLSLNSSKITDAGLEHLKPLTQLRELNLAGCRGVTDKGLEHLKSLKSLTSISVINTKLTDAGIEELKQALPKCRVVHKKLVRVIQ